MRTNRRRALAGALLGACLAAGAAHAQGPEWRFSGFGTLGAVYSDERNADFVSNPVPPNGAGATRATATTPDSKLAGQLEAIFNPQWSAVLQLVAQQRYDNSFGPEVEWANVKYQPTPEWTVRVGRSAVPFLLQSDTRLVGFAQPWVRPPVEVYPILPVTHNDGIDVLWRKHFDRFDNSLQFYYGRNDFRTAGISIEATRAWGISNAVHFGDLTLRAGYSHSRLDIEMQGIELLLGGLDAFATMPPPVGPQAAALRRQFDPSGSVVKLTTVGASYDPGPWFITGELVDSRGNRLPPSRAGYLTGGYRFGAFTPYLGYSRVRTRSSGLEPALPTPAAAPLNAAMAGIAQILIVNQSTVSAGVRWDLRRNTALKLQYDHVDLGSGSSGRFINYRPGWQPGGNVNVLSVTLDFVF